MVNVYFSLYMDLIEKQIRQCLTRNIPKPGDCG